MLHRQTQEPFFPHILQTSAELLISRGGVGGGLQNYLLCELLQPPQPCLDQSMLLHLQAMSCPAGAAVPWRATKKHMRLPLPLDPPLTHFFLTLFLNISALNYTSSLIKRKLTNTWYFLFSCRSTVDSAFYSQVILIFFGGILFLQ